MQIYKVSTYNFGLEGIESFVQKNFYQPSKYKEQLITNEDWYDLYYFSTVTYINMIKAESRTGHF